MGLSSPICSADHWNLVTVLQETHLWLWKFCSRGNPLFSGLCPLDFNNYVSDFQLEKQGHRTWANIFICLLDHAYEALLMINIKLECQKWPEKHLILGRSGTQYVAMVTKLLSLYCGAHLVRSYCKETNICDTNWLWYLFIVINQNMVLSVWCHYFG